MSSIRLDFPDLTAFPSYLDALREGHAIGIAKVMSDEEVQEIANNPDHHLMSLNAPINHAAMIVTPDGSEFPMVPYERLWLTQGDQFIGEVSLRLELSELLQKFGGHIGYGIRPSRQGEGMGTLALKMTIDRARDEHGITELLLTCSPNNTASERIILNNNGIFVTEAPTPYGYDVGENTRFFTIDTKVRV